MKNSVLLSLALFGFGIGAAQARNDPSPPPSGIVVHLFGPGSITSAILPERSAPAPAPGGSAPAGSAPAGSPPAGSPPAASTYVEPSAGDILHQMFITGDPNRKPGDALAKGRPAEGPGMSSP